VSNTSRKVFVPLYAALLKISARMHLWNGPRKTRKLRNCRREACNYQVIIKQICDVTINDSVYLRG